MVFKVKLLPIFFIFNFLTVFSQEIAIPYRDGEKWGMCNPDGKIIIEPKYDKLEFKENYDSDFRTLYPKIKNKTGLIIDGKVVFEAKYSRIYEDDNNYVLISEESNSKNTEIVNKEGNSILKKPIIKIISSEYLSENLKLYHVLNTDFTESIFTLNKKTNTIENWLYEDYYSLSMLKKIGGRYDLVFNVKKIQNDALANEVWNFEKTPYVKSKKMIYESEEKYLTQFYKLAKYKNDDYEIGYGGESSYGSETVVEDAVYSVAERGDMGEVVDIGEYNSESNKKPQLYFNYTLKKENEKLVLETKQENIKEAKKIIKPVKIKEAVKNLEIINYYFNKNTKDSIQSFRNIAYYKTKNKTGVIFPTNTSKIIEFDTIVKAFNNIRNVEIYDGIYDGISFVVGNKVNKTNNFKYSLYSSKTGLFFPLQFDELTNYQLRINNGNIVYKTRIGNKFGLIESNGKVLLKTEYDDFKKPSYNSGSKLNGNSSLLQKNNKFGIIYHNSTTYKDEIIEALFDYEILDVFVNYPNKGRHTTTNSKITLVSLKNENNEIIGYANANGMLYFKN